MIALGSTVKDMISGFEGVAIARSEWLYGCNRIIVESKTLKDGKPTDGQWFDEQRIKTIETDTICCDEPKKCTVKLGNKVRDTLSGYEGMAVAKTVWASGNVTISVEPTELQENGQPIASQAFDVHRLVITSEPAIPVSEESEAPTGGPQNDPCQAR